ncbi:MAG: hypothetical protein JNL41_03515 [Phenylobacterium sp.]|uniref:hypothetical protein n=1 Tax=Phenylobacterium sp. TaxID=1871053 RepID=UPI001A45FDEC|nr:hypothetical protein [Phenylobacterium sp.]MBL8553322.1 hypothetical protein [Phenylobacterium sp.]
MTRAVPIVGIVAALAAAPAAAAGLQAQAGAQTVIVEPMAIRMQWATAMPSVRGAADGAVFSGAMPSMALGMMMPANARLMIQREDETGEPATAPGAFDVTTIRDQPAVLVRTGLTDTRIGGDHALVGGEVRAGTAASIGVARGGLILASTGSQAPGSSGTLVVMVQYN